MIKFICLDIDGTLLNSKHQITEETKKAIDFAVRERNIPVVLVSARMPKGIVFLQEELDIKEPIICYSGSLVLDKDKDILLSTYMDNQFIREIVGEARKCSIHSSLYKDDQWYIEDMDYWASQEKAITNIEPVVTEYNKLFNIWEQEKRGCNKILCMGKAENIAVLRDILLDKFENQLNIYMSKPTYLEIIPKTASKTSAISFLLEQYNIDKSELMTIGDNYNDMDMLRYADYGIAMGNAPKLVKEAANYVTLTNDENGVAYAINKYIF